jgi:hypothetical protein
VLSSAPLVAPPRPKNTSFNLLIGPTTTTISSLSMETEDLSGLPAFGDYADGSESNKLHNSNDGPVDINLLILDIKKTNYIARIFCL